MKKTFSVYVLDFASRVDRVLKRAELDFSDLQDFNMYTELQTIIQMTNQIPNIDSKFVIVKYRKTIGWMFKIYIWCKLYGHYACEDGLKNDIELLSLQTKKHLNKTIRRARDIIKNIF